MPWVVIAVVTAGQRLTPDHLQGRVAATITFLLFATRPPARALGAALIGVLDYRVGYLLAAGIGAGLGAWVSVRAPSATRHEG